MAMHPVGPAAEVGRPTPGASIFGTGPAQAGLYGNFRFPSARGRIFCAGLFLKIIKSGHGLYDFSSKRGLYDQNEFFFGSI